MPALAAMVLGVLAASSLLIGTGLTFWLRPSNRVVGLIMGFGSGALISAVAYELTLEASLGSGPVFVGLGLGAIAFFAGDWLIDRRGGQERKSIAGATQSGSGQAIFLGTLLDAIPESLVIGIGVAAGEMTGLSFLVAVFVSNLPEAIAATTNMRDTAMPQRVIWLMWLALVAISGVAAGLGYLLTARIPSFDGSVVQAFAAGAILTMLADTMMPEAFEHGGRTVGLVTVLGFAVAAALSFAS
jgi:ZIP family zinc transporter